MLVQVNNQKIEAFEWTGNVFEAENFLDEDSCFIDEEDTLFINNRYLSYSWLGLTEVKKGTFITKDSYGKIILWPSETFWLWFKLEDE
jgi:hypothetical protein